MTKDDRRTSGGRLVRRVTGAVLLLVLVAACRAGTDGSAGGSAPETAAQASGATSMAPGAISAAPADVAQASATAASQLLATIAVKGRAPMTGYARTEFGSAWTDNNPAAGGHNGCDTRNDILTRDLIQTVIKNCAVQSGVLHDPYTGKLINFHRGAATSDAVQIDHVVALGDAWQTGAQTWPASTRVSLANDPLNLLAVNGPTNQAKGDADAASWLPPSKAYRCAYVARQVAVKARYGLWMTDAEHDAITLILRSCPTQRAPAEPGRPSATPASTRSANTSETRPPAPPSNTPTSPQSAAATPVASSSAPVYYSDCAAVRAAAKAPLYLGDPGYRIGLDGDRNGIACE
jgi:hypothetical protein